MPVLFFSGGIDSTVLAYDLAKRPYAYGVSYEHEDLWLVSYGKSGKSLDAFTRKLKRDTGTRAQFRTFSCPLLSYKPAPVPQEGHGSMVPSVGPLVWDRRSMPYTAGLMTWLASLAFNLVNDWDLPHGKPQVFFGFQYEPQAWAEYDGGKLAANDTSPAYIEALNRLSAAAGEPAHFRAPYLENRMSRYHIVQLGQELGASLENTHSCVMLKTEHCNRCCQCIKRMVAFKALGIEHD